MYMSALTEAAAAEPEDAIDERLGAPGRVHHIIDVAPQRGVRRGLLLHELAVAQDCAEYIVEVVGDAACQGAHCLHLLRLAQLCLQSFSVQLRLLLGRNIDGRSDEAIRPTR